MIVAAWLVEAKKSIVENLAPVLTAIFTPLFAVMLVASAVGYLVAGIGRDFDRDLLTVFDVLLLVVLGLVVYGISARRPGAGAGAMDVIRLVAVVAAIVLDVLVLVSMFARVGEFGFTPNRVAALGLNILLLVNLAGTAWLIVRQVTGKSGTGPPRTLADRIPAGLRRVGAAGGAGAAADLRVRLATCLDGGMAEPKEPPVELQVGERTVRLSSPSRVYFPARGETKLDLVNYYLSVGDGIVNALRERPCMMHRFPTGVAGEKVHQKRLPNGAPPWMETVQVFFPRYKRTADELCVTELAHVIWAVQMSTVEFHPWNSRRADTEKPDEWRIDLDPGDASSFAAVQRVAGVAHEVLDELGATGWPKTSGGSGLHVYVRIKPEHGFSDVRRAALAFAREVERRAPQDVTTTWWRKDRDPAAVFVDYNQNARDHTIASAYSVRGNPEGTVSTPIAWDEVDVGGPARLHDRDRAGALRRSSATCTPGSTRPCSTSRRCSSGRSATRPRAPRCRRSPRTRSRRARRGIPGGSAVR